jgi:hypothetical protein
LVQPQTYKVQDIGQLIGHFYEMAFFGSKFNTNMIAQKICQVLESQKLNAYIFTSFNVIYLLLAFKNIDLPSFS